ncbi:hypothetical protein MLD38_010265 [Melastoma candidum]|uniref:Uncharacterized protein n=1 Tax=Melastoma candidum TaxID=119954 RepID=A0ACB9R7M1_9MYRT|nr:hypothetical protein MLD38_010265 [Melastoma candidum]
MDWFWVSSVVSIVLIIILCLISLPSKAKKSPLPLPPGPSGLPVLGNLLSLGKDPHRDLDRLSREYGPIMYVRLGLVPTVVVSSPKYAEMVLKTQDLVFASRPPHEGSRIVSYGQRNLTFAPYGPYWRFIRKKCTLELLSASKMSSFRPMRREEIGLLIKDLKKAAADRADVDLSGKISSTGADMSCQMVFGRKYMDDEFSERGFKAVIQEAMQLAAAPNIGEFIPFLRPLDLQGLGKKLKHLATVFDVFFEKIIDDHVAARQEGRRESRDFVDSMLGIMEEDDDPEFRVDRRHIKAIMLDMLVASMDTSATAVDWAMVELIRNPRIMKKLQNELESTIGLDRVVEESDLEGLRYLDMVIKETFRLHPVAPLLLPHESTEDCVINGYSIPAKSRLIVNIWSIGRDPSIWSEAEKFIPERFEESSVDVRGRDFQLLPFGAGRRGCPGLQLGLTLVRLMLAQLVHCFDWELPDGVRPSDLDMREEFGITVPRAEHLVVIPTYRLRM